MQIIRDDTIIFYRKANFALSLPLGFHVFSVPPPGVDVWLPSDSLGTAFPQVDIEDEGLSTSESDYEDDSLSDFSSKKRLVSSSRTEQLSGTMSGSSSMFKNLDDCNNQNFVGQKIDFKI